MRPQEVVQVVQHDAGPDAHRAALDVEVGDLAVVAGKVYHQALTNRAADKTRPGTTRNNAHARLHRRLDHRAGLFCIARKGNRHGLELVDRGIGRVELAG